METLELKAVRRWRALWSNLALKLKEFVVAVTEFEELSEEAVGCSSSEGAVKKPVSSGNWS